MTVIAWADLSNLTEGFFINAHIRGKWKLTRERAACRFPRDSALPVSSLRNACPGLALIFRDVCALPTPTVESMDLKEDLIRGIYAYSMSSLFIVEPHAI